MTSTALPIVGVYSIHGEDERDAHRALGAVHISHFTLATVTDKNRRNVDTFRSPHDCTQKDQSYVRVNGEELWRLLLKSCAMLRSST